MRSISLISIVVDTGNGSGDGAGDGQQGSISNNLVEIQILTRQTARFTIPDFSREDQRMTTYQLQVAPNHKKDTITV